MAQRLAVGKEVASETIPNCWGVLLQPLTPVMSQATRVGVCRVIEGALSAITKHKD